MYGGGAFYGCGVFGVLRSRDSGVGVYILGLRSGFRALGRVFGVLSFAGRRVDRSIFRFSAVRAVVVQESDPTLTIINLSKEP